MEANQFLQYTVPKVELLAFVFLFSAMSFRASSDMVVYLDVSSCNYSLNFSTVGPAGKPSWMAFSTSGANLDKVR